MKQLANCLHHQTWDARSRRAIGFVAAIYLGFAIATLGQPFQLPTANRALFERGGEERYFVGTTGRPWPSGTFGCVRSEGFQLHEGLDIRSIKRDRRREPIDPILAACDGTVAYINTRAGTSNYGKYIVLKHNIEGLEVYTLYAHLSDAVTGLSVGQTVKAGDVIATMGRTSNTRERISLERAHLHFEINLFLNERFPTWFRKEHPKDTDDHGMWNGMNLVGLDPRQIFLEQNAKGSRFSLLKFIRTRTELCRVQIRDTNIPFVKRYPQLVWPNPVAQREGIAGYEFMFDFVGVPIAVTPRAASELKSKQKYYLVSVNAAEQQKHPCRKLVSRRGNGWELTNAGHRFLDLLTQ
jgi:peptidoglycan LD-endopeptidase LytH